MSGTVRLDYQDLMAQNIIRFAATTPASVNSAGLKSVLGQSSALKDEGRERLPPMTSNPRIVGLELLLYDITAPSQTTVVLG
jgi:hypothetical protein